MEMKDQYSNELSPEIKGNSGNYKINYKDMIMRAKTYIIYGGYRRYIDHKSKNQCYQHVAIKKYNSSEERFVENDILQQQKKNKEKNETKQKQLSGFIQFIQIVQGEKSTAFLIISNFKTTMYDKIKSGVRQMKQSKEINPNIRAEFIDQFLKKMVKRLHFYHYQCNKSQSIILTKLKPEFIGIKSQHKDQKKITYNYEYIIHDNSYSTESVKPVKIDFNNTGNMDYSYVAPECYTGTYTTQADIWSFGCILYELLSFGERLIANQQFHQQSFDKTEYIAQKLKELQFRLQYNTTMKQTRVKNSHFLVSIIKRCTQINPKTRISSYKLYTQIVQEKRYLQHQARLLFPQLSKDQEITYENKIIYDLSIQIFRLNQILNGIMKIFEEMYFNEKLISLKKYHLYPFLQMVSCYYLDLHRMTIEKARLYAKNQKWDKYFQIKMLEVNKINEIKNKASQKTKKSFENFNQLQIEKVKNMLATQFPQLNDNKVIYSQKLAFEICGQFLQVICKVENIVIFQSILYIIIFLLERQDFDKLNEKISLKQTNQNLFKHNPELLIFQKLIKINGFIDQQIGQLYKLNQRQKVQSLMQKKIKKFLPKYIK